MVFSLLDFAVFPQCLTVLCTFLNFRGEHSPGCVVPFALFIGLDRFSLEQRYFSYFFRLVQQ